MKVLPLLFAFLLPLLSFNQKHTPLPHGMVYGTKPNTAAMLNAKALEVFMGKKTRINTTITGKVIKVIKQKGGWFNIDAGNGKTISAHFRDFNITLPTDLKGRYVIAEGVAENQIIADDLQHLSGDSITGKKQHFVKKNPKQVTFEVIGLMVDK